MKFNQLFNVLIKIVDFKCLHTSRKVYGAKIRLTDWLVCNWLEKNSSFSHGCMEGNENADLEFAGQFNTRLKLRYRQPQITNQYMDLGFNVSLQCIPLEDLLDEPCLDSSSGSRFHLGTSIKCTLPHSFCWKTLLTPTEVSTNLGSLCWASDLYQRAWQTLCCVPGSDLSPAGEALLMHGMVPLWLPRGTLL